MTRRVGDRICEEFFVACYWGACVVLKINPGADVLSEMAHLTSDERQAMQAIEIMRDAHPGDRVTAALRMLRNEYVPAATGGARA